MKTRALLCLLTLITLLSGLSCGGGTALLLPILTAVSPNGVVGQSGQTVQFQAIASNLDTPTYRWNFGAGATPTTSMDAAPTVMLGNPGTYLGSLLLCNPDGCDDSLPFSFTVAAPTDPPTITGVAPAGGFSGEEVEFSALASNGPTSWNWTIPDGATPAASTAARPLLVLGAAGVYNGTVVATNIAGSSAPFDFTFTVVDPTGPPVVTAVTPSGTVGTAGGQVQFNGIASQGPTTWSWDFGGGANPNTSTAAYPLVTLDVPGTYSGMVTATNALGSSAPFSFNFTVGNPSPPVWTNQLVDSATDSGKGGYDIATLDGRLVVAYRSPADQGLVIAHAKITQPVDESDWERTVLAPGSGFEAGFNPSLAWIGDRLAVTHVRVTLPALINPTLLYAVSTIAVPTNASDWKSHIVVQEDLGSTELLALKNNRPAIVYTGPGMRPRLAVGLNADPLSISDWDVFFIATPEFNDPFEGTVRDGRVAVAIGGADGLWVAQADADFPISTSAFTLHEPLASLTDVQAPRITTFNGKLVIACGDDLDENSSRARILFAQTEAPTSAANWNSYVVDSATKTGIGMGIAEVGGRLALSYYQAVAPGSLYELRVARALTPDPGDLSEWQVGVVVRSVSLVPAETEVIGLADGRLRVIGITDPGFRPTLFTGDTPW